jgi:hypothetical protein
MAVIENVTAKIPSVGFTIGAEATNAITVAVQLNGPDPSQDLQGVGVVEMWLSDASTGVGLTGTAPSGGVAAGTDGEIFIEHVANKHWTVQSEVDGDIDIVLTDTGTPTFYLAVKLPNGTIKVSTAITFA